MTAPSFDRGLKYSIRKVWDILVQQEILNYDQPMLERKYVVVEGAERKCVEVTNLTMLLPGRLRIVLRFAQKRKEITEEKYFQ